MTMPKGDISWSKMKLAAKPYLAKKHLLSILKRASRATVVQTVAAPVTGAFW